MRRRNFLTGAAGLGAAPFASAPVYPPSGDSSIEVLVDEPIGTISHNIYGHFTEHIGAVIYDGVRVGENSKIPNVNGIRKALVNGWRQIKVQPQEASVRNQGGVLHFNFPPASVAKLKVELT